MLKKIVILGPESTGKSTLCQQLAAHYQTLWVKEYAREYLLLHGMNYTFDDLLTIAKGQVAGEEAAVEKLSVNGESQFLFIDTNMYVMKVWCEFVFGNCHDWIKAQIAERKYDLYLLCNTDLPWVKDELREYPDLTTRDTLYHIYENILRQQPVPFSVVSGTHAERLQSAIDAVAKFC